MATRLPRGQDADDAVDAAKAAASSAAQIDPMTLGILGATVGPGLISGAAKLTGKIGDVTGVKAISDAGHGAHQKITAALDNTVEGFLGGNPVSSSVGKAAQRVADATGDGLKKIADVTGFSSVAPKISALNAQANFSKVQTQASLDNIGPAYAALPSALRRHADAILEHVKQPNADSIDQRKFEKAKEAFEDAIGKTKGLSASEQMAIKSFKSIIKTAGKAIDSHSNAVHLSNIGSAVKELPQAIAKSKIVPGVMNTAFIGMSAAGMYGVAQGFGQNLNSLKEMYTDITGKKASTFAILTGDVPEPVADARSKLIKNFGVSEAASFAGLVGSVLNAARGKMGILSFVAPMAIGVGGSALVGDSSLSYYTPLKAAHKEGHKIPPEAYAEFIGKASHELRIRGGSDNAFTKKLAEKYAEENASPVQVMREINDGTIMKRVDAIIAENEAAKAAGAVPEKSYVAALKEPTKTLPVKKELPVVGDHTSKLAVDAAQANHSVGLGGA